MSNRYKGAVISATPPTTTGGESGTASGAWTLEQQMQLQAAGLWPLQPTGPYIEEVFNTGIYSATGGSETFSILGSVNMYTKGGLVWIKARTDAVGHYLIRPVTGASSPWNQSNGNGADGNFGTSEFRVNSNNTVTMSNGNINSGGTNYVSWNFAKQPKFFDIVTYTGNGVNGRTVAHNLTSTPGCIIVKRTDSTGAWYVYHRSTGLANFLVLNTTAAVAGAPAVWDGAPTSTTFTIQDATTNINGATYVAYLFAHDAGGFGLTGTDNVISCGSFTTVGSGKMSAPVNLGYEPQWLMIKNSGATENWTIYDTMRGLSYGGYKVLYPNLGNAEDSSTTPLVPTATGFDTPTANGPFANFSTYIYVAIRRGPMRTPTVGTTVYAPVIYTGDNSNTRVITTGFPPDMVWTGTTSERRVGDRLRGLFTNPGPINTTYSSSDEQLSAYSLPQMSGWQTGNGTVRFENSTAVNYVLHAFKRAPSFFDVVCYTGTGSATTFAHNLTVVPELIFIKCRSAANGGLVYNKTITASKFLELFFTGEGAFAASGPDAGPFNSTTPTSSVFSVGTYSNTNGSGATYVAYLFATCAGVSKVGTYTGTGASQTIDCGFTAGSRFVLIKRTDSTGDWYLWDSARGIVAGNDPYLLLNSNTAEVTNTDYIDTTNVGFDITSTAPAGINANGGTYIFLAIA